jgi:hypothetical protein
VNTREKLPETRKGIRRKFKIQRPDKVCLKCETPLPSNGPLKMWVTINTFPDGRPGEIFIKADKEGSLAGGSLDAAAISVSMALQHGVPFEDLMRKWVGLRFEPSGVTSDKDYPFVSSPLDYIARWALDRFGKKEAA